jgi:hypothetical protein
MHDDNFTARDLLALFDAALEAGIDPVQATLHAARDFMARGELDPADPDVGALLEHLGASYD